MGSLLRDPVGDVLIKGLVFCVNASGNEAIVGIIVEESNTSFVPPGSAVLRKVIDNGQGSHDPPDQTGTILVLSAPAELSQSYVTFIATGPVDQGNFVVTDAG